MLLDPHLALTRRLLPYWSAFPVDASADALERHLDAADDAAKPYVPPAPRRSLEGRSAAGMPGGPGPARSLQ